MTDFLDRIAARAVGTETVLAPRLPSLFESPRYFPAVLTDEHVDTPLHPLAARSELAAVAVAAPTSAVSQAMPSGLNHARAAPLERAAASTRGAALAASPPREETPEVSARPRSSPVAERLPDLAASREPAETVRPAPVPARQTRVAPDRHESNSPPDTGVLLPPPRPVFAVAAQTASPPVHSGQVAARSRLAARTDSPGEAARDQVVHVSIGRLEVRAAATPVVSPRRKDGPRPSSLDDYLRQRGDKASP